LSGYTASVFRQAGSLEELRRVLAKLAEIQVRRNTPLPLEVQSRAEQKINN
jgi:hypothetical protein